MTNREVDAVLGRPKHYGSRNWDIREFPVRGKLGKTLYQCGYEEDGLWHGVSGFFPDRNAEVLRTIKSGMICNERRLGLRS
ncbi:MAG: hypothetical protein LUD72_06220 [Bacteroidales bacterium]|nr:hypothetical protein [Bacteroidales bacterium]